MMYLTYSTLTNNDNLLLKTVIELISGVIRCLRIYFKFLAQLLVEKKKNMCRIEKMTFS